MPASESTKLQLNIKTHGDTLINVYADNPDEFTAIVSFLSTQAGTIAELESALKGASALGQAMQVTQVAPEPAYAPQTFAQQGGYLPPDPTPPPAPAWGAPAAPPQAYGQPSVPLCQHGQRVARSGNGAKGPWKAYFCPTPKGTPNQCDAVFLKNGSPEWNAFVG